MTLYRAILEGNNSNSSCVVLSKLMALKYPALNDRKYWLRMGSIGSSIRALSKKHRWR